MKTACRRVRKHLEAFLDGELAGAERQIVAQHLDACQPCAGEYREIQSVGELLRAGAGAASGWDALTGLSSGVITRVRAEEAQSWGAIFSRAVEDWHWTLVGAGSIAAAFASILFVSVACWFNPTSSTDDSLAALLANLETPAGTLVVVAKPIGRDQVPMLMQFDSGVEGGGVEAPTMLLSNGFSGPNENDLVLALSDAVVSADGRMSDLRSMSQPDRRRTELLLDKLEQLRAVPQNSWSGGRVSVLKLGLLTNTNVSGKPL
jgi:hypothetical protein